MQHKLASRLVPTLLLMRLSGALPAQERFSDRIAVTEVEEPVRVLIKGQPLSGLTQDDFELYDEGVLQDILGFEERDLRFEGIATAR